MNRSQLNRLLGLYDEYFKNARRLMQKVEELLETFPNYILREIRNFNDHISRIFLTDTSSRQIDLELEDAKDHLNRCILDCHKRIIIELEIRVEKFMKKYQNVSLGLVDNGNFYPKFQKLLNQGRILHYKAKIIENLGRRKLAREAFKNTSKKFFELMDFINSYESSKKLKWASRYTKRRLFLDHTITLFSGVLVTIIIRYLYSPLSKFVTIIKNYINN